MKIFSGIYEVPMDVTKDKVESAVLSPSSTETRAAPAGKQRQLDPSSIDTGKDTQSLVQEDHEC
jgi:hypothetical protein